MTKCYGLPSDGTGHSEVARSCATRQFCSADSFAAACATVAPQRGVCNRCVAAGMDDLGRVCWKIPPKTNHHDGMGNPPSFVAKMKSLSIVDKSQVAGISMHLHD